MKLDQRFDSVSILCGTNFQGMEAIAMHYCAMLTIPSIVTLLLSLLYYHFHFNNENSQICSILLTSTIQHIQ